MAVDLVRNRVSNEKQRLNKWQKVTCTGLGRKDTTEVEELQLTET